MKYEKYQYWYIYLLYGWTLDIVQGTLDYLGMAATSKIVAASLTYPFLVLRARLQDQDQRYTSTLDTAKRIWR